MREIEQDGFITDEIYIQETKPLERVDMDRAIPAKGCKYPKCEECRDYRNGYCTVPIVVTKQMWLMKGDTTDALIKDVSELREMVYDEILGKKSEAETGNYSVEDDLYEVTYYEPTVGWHDTIATMKGIEKLQMEYMDVMVLGKTDRKVGDEP